MSAENNQKCEAKNKRERDHYRRNRDKIAERKKAYRAKNKALIRRKQRERYARERDAILRQRGTAENLERKREVAKENRERLTDGYVRSILVRDIGVDPPASLIEAKRAHLLVARELKKGTSR